MEPAADPGLSPSASAADSLGGDLPVHGEAVGGRGSGFPSCELQRGSSLSASSASASAGNLEVQGVSASVSPAASPIPGELNLHSFLPATTAGMSEAPP
eukprot:scaffold166737_cov13-Tisochrysis_lutea.AAC.1